MSKHLKTVSFQPDEKKSGSVRLNGSVSFDVSIELDGAPEQWVGAMQAAFGDVARRWLVDVLKQSRSEATGTQAAQDTPLHAVEEPEEEPPRPSKVSQSSRARSLAEDLIASFEPVPADLGDELTSQVAEEEQEKRAAICQTREFPRVTRSEPAVEPAEASTVAKSDDDAEEAPAAEVSDETRPTVMVSPELTFAHGLEEDSDSVFFSDVPVTENVSSEHSHASIRVSDASTMETRDYTPTERPTSLDKTSPSSDVVEVSEDWFSDRDIEGIVEDAKDSFEEEDSDALIAALPSLNQKIGHAPTGRIPRPSTPRPAKFSERAATGTALARLQKRLRAQRRCDD